VTFVWLFTAAEIRLSYVPCGSVWRANKLYIYNGIVTTSLLCSPTSSYRNLITSLRWFYFYEYRVIPRRIWQINRITPRRKRRKKRGHTLQYSYYYIHTNCTTGIAVKKVNAYYVYVYIANRAVAQPTFFQGILVLTRRIHIKKKNIKKKILPCIYSTRYFLRLRFAIRSVLIYVSDLASGASLYYTSPTTLSTPNYARSTPYPNNHVHIWQTQTYPLFFIQ